MFKKIKNKIKTKKYAPIFAAGGFEAEYAGEFQGVDIVRISAPTIYLGYYPAHDFIGVTDNCFSMFTKEQLESLFLHEIGHKVHEHDRSAYMDIETGTKIELEADKYAMDHSDAATLYSALELFFQHNVKGYDYEPRMEQLRKYL